MINEDNVIVMDIDGTLCEIKKENEEYIDIMPKNKVLQKLREYKDKGFYIILYTSRNMRSYQANIGKINAITARVLFDWLEKNDIPYDEIYFGKPWCGLRGFYVDDKAIRPDEFIKMQYEEIVELFKGEE